MPCHWLVLASEEQTAGTSATSAPSGSALNSYEVAFSHHGAVKNITEAQCPEMSSCLVGSPMVENTVLTSILDHMRRKFTGAPG